MAKAVNLFEKSGPNPGFYKLGKKEIVGYSLVDGGMNLIFQSLLMFITFFYTDVYGLTAAETAVMYAVARGWDIIWDPTMGVIAERMHPKKGKYKPYLIFGAIPFGIIAILTFTVPNFGHGGKLAWAYLTYFLLNTLYTFIINPYISCTTVMTADPEERTKLNSVRMTFAQSGGVIVALFIPILSSFFGQGDTAKGYQLTIVLLACITCSILFYSYTTLHERIKVKSHLDPVTFKKFIYQITHNQPGVILFLLFVGVYGFSTITSTAGVYYMTYDVKRTDLVALFSVLNVLPSVFAVPFVPLLFRTIHKKNTVALGLLLGIVGCSALYAVPFSQIAAIMICKSIGALGYGILMGSLWSIIPDDVEYAEYRTGKRYPAVVYTLITLGLKVSMAVGGMIPAMILAAVKYAPNIEQTQTSKNGILFMTTFLPAIICAATLLIFYIFYPLTEKRVAGIMTELDTRHQNQKSESGESMYELVEKEEEVSQA